MKYSKQDYEGVVIHNSMPLKFKFNDRLTVQKATFDYRDGLLSTKRDCVNLEGSIEVGENTPINERDSAQNMVIYWN